MTADLRERVARELRLYASRVNMVGASRTAEDHADAILALVRDHLTSDAAVKRAGDAFWDKPGNSHEEQMRAIILAALDGGNADDR